MCDLCDSALRVAMQEAITRHGLSEAQVAEAIRRWAISFTANAHGGAEAEGMVDAVMNDVIATLCDVLNLRVHCALIDEDDAELLLMQPASNLIN